MNPAAATPSQAKPSSSHRLSAVTALDALDDLEADGPSNITTGLSTLDAVLCSTGSSTGGLERGKVYELWGPNGAGSTALMLQASIEVLRLGGGVVWVDGGAPLSQSRLETAAQEVELKGFRQMTVATFSHLLALVLHPRPTFAADGTRLLVIEGINGLVDIDYPRFQASGASRTEQQKWLAGRRWAVLGSLVTALNKLAVSKNLVVIASTGCASRMRSNSGLGSALVPGVGGPDWDSGIWSRLVVFQDYNARFVGAQKCQGKSLISREEVGEVGRLIPFEVGQDGLPHQILAHDSADKVPQVVLRTPAKPRKRFFHEVADSEEDEDDYGWLELDEETMAMGGEVGPTVVAVEGNAEEPIDVG